MLKPAAMQRIAVVGSKDERRKIVSVLYDIGVLQIEPLSKDAASFMAGTADSPDTREVSEQVLRIRSLRAALPPGAVATKRGFGSFQEVLSVAKSIDIDVQVSKLKQDEERLRLQLEDLKSKVDLVTKLSFINEDLNIFDLASAASFFGSLSVEAHQELVEGLATIPETMVYSSGSGPISTVVVVPNEALDRFGAMVQRGDLRLQRIPPMKGRPSEVLSALNAQQRDVDGRLDTIAKELADLSGKYYGLLSSVEEQLSIEARKLEVVNSFGFTDSTFALEGWVPVRKSGLLEEALARFSKTATFFKLHSEEKPPTLLENPKQLKFFESFIRFYNTPQSNEIDPSIIFAIAFPIFFGLMLGDVGYAVLVLLISIWIIRRVKHPERKTLVPAFLRSFAGRILKPAQFSKLAKAMVLGSLAGIVMGFTLNTYFGFTVNQYLFTYLNANFHLGLPSDGTFLNPISTVGLKELLLYSGYIGLFMVSFGLVLGVLNAYWMKSRKHMIGKIGWLSTAWGISLTGLALLRGGSLFALVNPISNPLIFLIFAGIGLIIYGEGAQAMAELPSIVSNIISYTRLLGILLASFVLAYLVDSQVVGPNSAGSPGLLYGGIAYSILGVVLLVVVHLFNTILGILEPGIQGARLIYVEHFSKYLHGEGEPFTPFKGSRTHTLNETEMMESNAPG